MADQGSLSERFPLDEWIEAVENLVTQMGYADWCEFRRIQEDETPELVEVWVARRTSDGRLNLNLVERRDPKDEPLMDGWEWVRFVAAPF